MEYILAMASGDEHLGTWRGWAGPAMCSPLGEQERGASRERKRALLYYIYMILHVTLFCVHLPGGLPDSLASGQDGIGAGTRKGCFRYWPVTSRDRGKGRQLHEIRFAQGQEYSRDSRDRVYAAEILSRATFA